jgi:hypothetical protein
MGGTCNAHGGVRNTKLLSGNLKVIYHLGDEGIDTKMDLVELRFGLD